MQRYVNPQVVHKPTEPHPVTSVGGQMWGNRVLNARDRRKANTPNPIAHYYSQFLHGSKTSSEMQGVRNGMENGAYDKVYYMNTPADSRFKEYLHELGRYQRPAVDGMYNQHENLQEGASNMMHRRVMHGMV